MADKTSKIKPPPKPVANVWGFTKQPLLLKHLQATPKAGQKVARVQVQLSKKAKQVQRIHETDAGVEVLLSPLSVAEAEKDARLKVNSLVRIRDTVGASLGLLEKMDVEWVEYSFDMDPESLNSALLGLEIALYRFKRMIKGENAKLTVSLKNKNKPINEKALGPALTLGSAVNLARHLTNLPANLLNPATYSDTVRVLMSGSKNISVDIWDEARLKKEKMFLHLSVGQGAEFQPCLVHIRYRPSGAKKAPIAFVGKGITFDSGGLDIKPSAGMRLMKKDMGGSASVLGVAYWAAQTGCKLPMDFYLPLAENAIGSRSFRPGDVLTARNESTVEIHNTDAEGRLVLADAMDVAATQTEKPRCIIDVATLTGAIKIALGSGLAGLFSNDPKLAQSLAAAGQQSGDLTWTMPLFQKYRAQTASNFADQVNAVDGFGGAITAALFLEKFAREIPWAHFDIYAWKDSAETAWLEAGGSGQSVMGLVRWLQNGGGQGR